MRCTMRRMAMTREQQIEHILKQLEEKRSLSDICKSDAGMPTMSAFLGWVRKDATLAERYSHAREAQVTGLLEEMIQIADSATDDIETYFDTGKKRTVARINGKAIRRAQVMVETRERFAKLMAPERFATQRTDITSGGKALPSPVQTSDNRIVALLMLAAERAAQLSAASRVPVGTVLDVPAMRIEDVMDA